MSNIKAAIIDIVNLISDEGIVLSGELSYKLIMEPIYGYEVFLDDNRAIYIHKSIVDDYCVDPLTIQEDSISRIVDSIHEIK